MREENFRAVCESENLSIRGPEDAKKDKGWVFEPDRQRMLLERFWSKFEKNRSLVFFYCNQANPLKTPLASLLELEPSRTFLAKCISARNLDIPIGILSGRVV
jgi:hypothetical protein